MAEIEVGGQAYLDGRDPAAQPPLTAGTINRWVPESFLSRERHEPIGDLV